MDQQHRCAFARWLTRNGYASLAAQVPERRRLYEWLEQHLSDDEVSRLWHAYQAGHDQRQDSQAGGTPLGHSATSLRGSLGPGQAQRLDTEFERGVGGGRSLAALRPVG